MDRVRLYLKTPFFDTGRRGDRDVPYAAAMVLDGELSEAPGGVRIRVTGWRTGDGKELADLGTHTLILPIAKIDHMVVLHEEG